MRTGVEKYAKVANRAMMGLMTANPDRALLSNRVYTIWQTYKNKK